MDKDLFSAVCLGTVFYFAFGVLGIILWATGSSLGWGIAGIICAVIAVYQFIRIGIEEEYKISDIEYVILMTLNFIPGLITVLFSGPHMRP